jgi:hypothetical protein
MNNACMHSIEYYLIIWEIICFGVHISEIVAQKAIEINVNQGKVALHMLPA